MFVNKSQPSICPSEAGEPGRGGKTGAGAPGQGAAGCLAEVCYVVRVKDSPVCLPIKPVGWWE